MRTTAKNAFRNMMAWAIRKIMEKYPEEIFSLGELRKLLDEVWDDLVEAGEIVLQNEDEP